MKHERKSFQQILIIIATVIFLVAVLITSIRICCFDRDFYQNEYEKLDTAESIGISKEDLDRVTDRLLGYLEGTYPDLNTEVNINNKLLPVFNEKEITHMIDVKNLYHNAVTVSYVLFGLAALLIVCYSLLSKKNRILRLTEGYLLGNAVFLGIVLGLSVWAIIDFASFWTCFHQIFFSNDLWILDARTDVLIQMVPSMFFFDLVIKIIILFLIIMGALAVTGIIVRALIKKRSKTA